MIIHKDYCSRCKEKHEHMTPYAKTKENKHGNITRYYQCHPCANKRQRERYKKDPEKGRSYVYKSIEKYKEKQAARILLNCAVNRGDVIRPEVCSVCKKKSDRIEGHHTDYSKPLEVVWTCTPCHSKEGL